MLIKGRWAADWQPVHGSDREGRFLRQPAQIRHWITKDGSPGPSGEGGFNAESGRYHLYVALICPWACRTLAVRALLKLEKTFSISIVSPILTEQGWRFGHFPGATEDSLYGSTYLHQLYTRNDQNFTGRTTIPILWDRKLDRMVNNESADIMRMLELSFPAPAGIDLYPESLREEIDRLNQRYYERLNNGVYRAGFASSQAAYDEACSDVFSTLNELEVRLKHGPFLFGRQLTETDIRLFVTLIRFDIAYYGLFKCNQQRIIDYPNLYTYLKKLYAIPDLHNTVNFTHIKQGYYSIRQLNPFGIVPQGPKLQFFEKAANSN